MLQDIKPYKLHNEYNDFNFMTPDDKSLLVIRDDGGLLIKECDEDGAGFSLPKVLDVYPKDIQIEEMLSEQRAAAGWSSVLTYLIAVDDVRFYAPGCDVTVTRVDSPVLSLREEAVKKLTDMGYSFRSTRDLRYRGPAWLRFGALTAWQVAGWYRNNRFCGQCGGRMSHSKKERAIVCESCKNTIYPKLCPVVIVGIIHDEKILLTKYAARGAYANYALVAGFAEIGETIEETVQREVMEETGLKVKNLRYYKSQPWAYSESLLFGFFCEAEGSAAVTVDGEELSLAKWTPRSEVPDYGDEISLTYEMMSQFRQNAGITRY